MNSALREEIATRGVIKGVTAIDFSGMGTVYMVTLVGATLPSLGQVPGNLVDRESCVALLNASSLREPFNQHPSEHHS